MPCDENRGWRVSSRPMPRICEWLPIRSTVIDRSLVSETVDTAFCRKFRGLEGDLPWCKWVAMGFEEVVSCLRPKLRLKFEILVG
jgi:hypothetical protein